MLGLLADGFGFGARIRFARASNRSNSVFGFSPAFAWLQAAVDFVDVVLEADRKAPRKQRHTAHRIWGSPRHFPVAPDNSLKKDSGARILSSVSWAVAVERC